MYLLITKVPRSVDLLIGPFVINNKRDAALKKTWNRRLEMFTGVVIHVGRRVVQSVALCWSLERTEVPGTSALVSLSGPFLYPVYNSSPNHFTDATFILLTNEKTD